MWVMIVRSSPNKQANKEAKTAHNSHLFTSELAINHTTPRPVGLIAQLVMVLHWCCRGHGFRSHKPGFFSRLFFLKVGYCKLISLTTGVIKLVLLIQFHEFAL